MKKEQEEWEKKNTEASAEVNSKETKQMDASLVEEMLEEFDNEPDSNQTSPISEPEVSEEPIEARPLPVKTRKARKKQD